MRFLLVHQSSELYGSDRSFLSVVEGVRTRHPDADIDVVLPDLDGPLVPLLKAINVDIRTDPNGYLRKSYLRNPLGLILKIFISSYEYLKLSRKYDVFYVNTVVCLSALLAARLFPVSWVHVRELPTGVSAYIFKCLLIISGAKKIYNSKATRDSFGLLGEVVYNGVAPVNRPDRSGSGLLFGDFSRKRKFLLIGRISEWKGQSFVIDALPQFSTPIDILILGGIAPGREKLAEELRNKAGKIETHNITFVDFLNDPSGYFEWADFVIVPSLLPEPFGRVAIEAMAYGLPPVVANHGGLSEIVNDDSAGLRFEPGNQHSFLETLETCVAMSSLEYLERSKRCLTIFQDMYTESSYQKRVCDLLE